MLGGKGGDAKGKGREPRLSQDWCEGREEKKSGECVKQGESTEKKRRVSGQQGHQQAKALDHPSGLAERLGWLDCGLPAGLDAWMNERRDRDRQKSRVMIPMDGTMCWKH